MFISYRGLTMKIVDRFRREGEQVMTARHAELRGWRGTLRRAIDVGRFCWRRMKFENAPAMSAALSFRTIFALIPALVLGAVLLKPFGLVAGTENYLRNFFATFGIEQIVVSEPLAPGATPNPDDPPYKVLMLSEQIAELVKMAETRMTLGTVGPVGVVLLIWTVMSLLTTTERSLNRIFGAQQVRPFGRRMFLYWSVVTLCPLLLITAVYLGRAAVGVLAGVPFGADAGGTVEWLVLVVIGVITLAIVYRLMPNTPVRLGPALVGAALAVPLFMLAKWGFGLYVSKLVVKGTLYGHLGLLPVFLVWVNLSWMVFLLGAVLTHTLASFSELRAAEEAEAFILSPSARVAAALAVARPYEAGRGPVSARELAATLRLPRMSVETLMEKLAALKIALRVETPAASWILARPAASIAMTELLEIGANEASRPAAEYDPEIAAAVERFRGRAAGALAGWTLADFLAEKK